jgi:hypothetical protein
MAVSRLLLFVIPTCRQFGALLALGAIAAMVPPAARSAEFVPKPDTYLCPDSTGGAVDCYLQPVTHL